ncbi:MAG: class I SAM-dependent methyltransferase [Verrucomicrobia bacterium]|nr:class I SAM-dependent methyltransferase [Verrucomicrobiota bacterium]
MPTKIKGREYGLEFALIVLNFLYKSKALHYGYWGPSDEVNILSFGAAQQRYTDNLLKHVPVDAVNILDIGCGTGIVAKHLVERGHHVECLSPSPFLNAEARKVLPPSTPVHETTFEEFRTDRRYDLIMFVESFQYIPLNHSLTGCLRLLKPGGRVLICDVFKLDMPGKGPIGGGRSYSEFIRQRDALGYACLQDVDITRNIAPTFDLVQDLGMNLMKPLWENARRVGKANHPFLAKTLLWIFRKELLKLNKHFNPDRNAKSFIEYKTYRIQLLAPPPSTK